MTEGCQETLPNRTSSSADLQLSRQNSTQGLPDRITTSTSPRPSGFPTVGLWDNPSLEPTDKSGVTCRIMIVPRCFVRVLTVELGMGPRGFR